MTLAQPAKHPDERRRRGVPTIPDQTLPANGRKGRPPACPLRLHGPGQLWWTWLWQTPQATQFNKGNLHTLARRAQLEDQFDAESGGEMSPEMVAAMVDRRLKILGMMFAIDEKLGLTPYGAARLHWWIKDEEKPTGKLSAVGDFSAKQRAKDLGTRVVAGS